MTKGKIVALCLNWWVAGVLVGLAIDYYIYRVWLPIAPFVYQAF